MLFLVENFSGEIFDLLYRRRRRSYIIKHYHHDKDIYITTINPMSLKKGQEGLKSSHNQRKVVGVAIREEKTSKYNVQYGLKNNNEIHARIKSIFQESKSKH